MKKVFAVIENYTFDFEHDSYVALFETMDKAKEYFDEVVEREKKGTWIDVEDDNCIIEESETFFDAYPYGEAGTYETIIRIVEKVVN